MLGKLSAEEIEKVLTENFVGHLGCHADGRTYVVPISYAYTDGCIWGRTFEGMKMDIIRQNPAVCFQVETIPSMSNWRSVIAWGEFEEITDPVQQTEIFDELFTRFQKLTPVEAQISSSAVSGEVALFRIRIRSISGVAES